MADEELAQPLPLPPDMTNAPPLPSGVPASPDQVQAQTAEAQPAAIPPPRPPGTSGLAQQAPSKGEIFRNMLGDFLYSAGKGLAAAGHGPEANARGAGEALTAIPERHIQQQMIAIQQKQAEGMAAYHQAQAGALQAGAETIQVPTFGPDGKVMTNPDGSIQTQPILQKDLGRYFGQTGAAGIRGAAAVTGSENRLAGTLNTNQTRENVQQTKGTQALEQIQAKAGMQSAFGKLTPEMAAIGMPPAPKDYPAGINDPQFKQAVQKYGQAVTDLKQKNAKELVGARGESFAYNRAKYMQLPVLNNNTQEMGFMSPLEIASHPEMKPLGEADRQLMKNAVFEDIKGAAGKLREAITANKDGFSPAQAAQLNAAMQTDPSGGLLSTTISTLAHAGAKDSLTLPQQKQAIAMQQAYENAYALRGVAGMGSGSDQLRDAIRATLPSASSPPGYALNQLTAFEQQVNRLHRGVPNMNLRNAGDTGQPSGKVQVKAPDGTMLEFDNQAKADIFKKRAGIK